MDAVVPRLTFAYKLMWFLLVPAAGDGEFNSARGTSDCAGTSSSASERRPVLLRGRMSVSWRRKIIVVVVAVVLTVSTPFFWLLNNPDTGQLVAASVQCATGVAALVWALMQSPATPEPGVAAVDTGKAKATGGGRAATGVQRPQEGGSGPVRAERTGDATADGSGSSANTGVDFS
ncbi:hypothetical protein [Streptomyces sp. NPDC055140]